MGWETLEQRLARIQREVNRALKQARAAEEYAETTARLHHEAICRLNEALGRGHRWPGKGE